MISNKPALSKKHVVAKVPESLLTNDTFLIKRQFEMRRFRVHKALDSGVWAHDLTWCKSSSVFYSFDELRKSGFVYYGRISKLRAFFMM